MQTRNQQLVTVIVILAISVTVLVVVYDVIAQTYVLHNHVRHNDVKRTRDVKLLKVITPASHHGSSLNNTFVSHGLMGRLGNVLFQYAAMYCIAKRNNLTPLFSDPMELKNVENPGTLVNYSVYLSKKSRTQLLRERFCCSYDNRFESLPNDHNYSIYGYFQSWRYFEPCKAEVLEIFKFKKKYVEEANTIIGDLRKQLPNKVLVGVHIRMEDHTSERATRNGKQIAPPEYFIRAMTYFKNRFHDVRFVVITSSQEWWLSNVTRSDDVVFHNRTQPAVDMEILSRLDHIIVSVGTFGWWAAYMNNGVVVIFNDCFKPGSPYGNQFLHNSTDYFYPGWLRM
ncbi:hypothetical protein V1264_017436 [Littorina saxatilis]